MIIDIDNGGKLTENDIIIYKKGRWTAIRKSEFLTECIAQDKELRTRIDALKNELESYKTEINEYKVKVNEKLKEYHNILQLLTKGEK